MSRLPLATTLALCIPVTLSACQQHDASPTVASIDEQTFHASGYPLMLHYDASLTSLDGQASSYFDNGDWQLADGTAGERLTMLQLPESDDVTTALWRLGASRDPAAVEGCLTLPANAQPMASKTEIAGQTFTGFTLDDAGMSHFQNVEGYRAVVDGACYAIDLIVQGTNGEVYDPPREAPFSREDAMNRLRSINDGVSFTHA